MTAVLLLAVGVIAGGLVGPWLVLDTNAPEWSGPAVTAIGILMAVVGFIWVLIIALGFGSAG